MQGVFSTSHIFEVFLSSFVSYKYTRCCNQQTVVVSSPTLNDSVSKYSELSLATDGGRYPEMTAPVTSGKLSVAIFYYFHFKFLGAVGLNSVSIVGSCP